MSCATPSWISRAAPQRSPKPGRRTAPIPAGFPGGPARGKEAVRAFYERLFADIAGERTDPVRRLYGPDFLVDEVVWHGRAVGRPFGFDGGNRPFSHRLLHVLEFRDGLICRENVWLDFAAIAEQLK